MSEEGNSGVVLDATHHPPPPPPPTEPHHRKGGSIGEPISASLGVDYPFPPHLEYAYPPPDGHILTNIVNALITVPRFYTQVLHLMNKMNLPAPFRPALPTPPLPPPAVPAQSVPKRQAGDLSSGESELESSDEEEQKEDESDEKDVADGNLMGFHTLAGQKKGQAKKRVKREAILGPAVDKGVSHEAAGVKAIVIPKAPAVIKKKAPVLQIKFVPKGSTSAQMDPGKNKAEEASLGEPAAGLEAPEEQLATASREELEAGKLQTSEMLSLPIFKKYTPGNPTPVLYIKNLAKDVTTDDMYYIYGAFFPNRATAVEQLSVKVMQEGRMRGQAFVSLPSAELAEVALAGTHGFLFKGKPMIVQYGRSHEAVGRTSSSSGAHES